MKVFFMLYFIEIPRTVAPQVIDIPGTSADSSPDLKLIKTTPSKRNFCQIHQNLWWP